jgi:bis(5'-nucleosyl)-tetraphosphatase (symmetrical)
MYGNEPARWDASLAGADRWRFVINTLTRIRFCSADGTLELKTKEGAAPHRPAPPLVRGAGAATAGTPMAFGHWSTLGLINRPDLLALDTGCVWGGALTAVRVDGGRRELCRCAATAHRSSSRCSSSCRCRPRSSR